MHSCLQALRPILPQVFFYRARIYAENRVICGHHWKTYTDAALMLAAGIFATVVSTDGYQEQLKKARAEYQRLKGNTRVETPAASADSKNAAIYDLQGRQLSSQPNNGVFVQNGQKYIAK